MYSRQLVRFVEEYEIKWPVLRHLFLHLFLQIKNKKNDDEVYFA